MGRFLEDQPGPRPWNVPEGGRGGFEATDLFLGSGANALEVVVANAAARPNVSDVRQLWKRRKANRPSPVLLVALYGSGSGRRAAVCGPVGEDPAVQTDLDPGQVERLAMAALAEPNRNAAIRFLAEALPETESELPGLRNQGMFATHELRDGVPRRADWDEMGALGRRVLSERGRNLVMALGYVVEELSASASVLRIAESNTRAAVAVFLDEAESPDGSTDRFGGTSPVSYALEKADAERLPYVVLTRGSQIRVYATGRDVGVGRKGRAETYIEANLALLPDTRAAFVPLLFGASALRDGGTFGEILERSRDFSVGLGERLRDRIYVHVVPQLATAIAVHHPGDPTGSALADLYEQTMVVLFRLLFIAYAEDKDLLPYRQNGLYQRNALKTLARDLAELANEQEQVPEFDPNASDLWSKVTSLWQAIDKGNRDWGVPEYNGGMFSSEAEVNPAGAAISGREMVNSELGPALFWLLVDAEANGGFGPVDFRSLSVREFGTIYEGLLESSLAFAETDLIVDENGTYLPARDGQSIAVEAGDIYLHDQSGTRKGTGSYFTKPFAVGHLLDHALEAALDEHVARLAEHVTKGHDAEAAKLFFDFRVADIAMGSGHFLVAAVDHIEARLSNFLATHPVPGVQNELERLRAAAHQNLGELADAYEIEDASLLRRQIARRCIYGVDLNLVAVELARLAMWIHTFVPGLPLSFLDHNLVEGNSLTGIGSVDDAADALDELTSRRTGRAGTATFGRVLIEKRLTMADEALRRLARSSDASSAEIGQARQAHIEAGEAVVPVKRLFDLLVANRLGECEMPYDDVEGIPDEILESDNPLVGQAATIADDLKALHFPVAFPEVFLRGTPGFDVIIGNPPWDKVRPEPQQFWVVRSPGLNALGGQERIDAIEGLRHARPDEAVIEQTEVLVRERLQAIAQIAYVHQGRGRHGHHDFAKLFVERFAALGHARTCWGVVLPRTSLVLSGWADLRRLAMSGSVLDLLQASNQGGWLFDDVHQQTTVVLLVRLPERADPGVRIRPSVTSMGEFRGRDERGYSFLPCHEVESLTETAAIPWFRSPDESHAFDRLRSFEKLGSDTGWITGTADSSRWDFSTSGRHHEFVDSDASEGAWNVLMARHVEMFRLSSDRPFQRFVTDADLLVPLGLGIEAAAARTRLAADHPAIVYRYATMQSNTRTLIAAMLPSSGYIYSKGYVHGIRHPGVQRVDDVFALLGYLNSFVCDWWVRRFVDRHVTKGVIENIPLPDWSEPDREEVAAIAAHLVGQGGVVDIPGDTPIPTAEWSGTPLQANVDLHRLVAKGFGLTRPQFAILLDGFSDQAIPALVREALLEGVQ